MRVLVEPRRRVGDADEVEQLEDALAARGRGDVGVVDRDRLADLAADGHHGVERGQVSWKTIEIASAAEALELPFGPAEQLLASELHRAAHRAGRQQPKERERGDGLARPRFADEADDLVVGDVEAEVVDGVEGPVVGRELDGEVLDVEERRGHVDRGSKASRSPSPRKLTARMVTRMASPGK